ncbi:MAG TPA: hypothetical protein VFQ80_05165 [Thermomicrobiales bacterium]|nr:hypothetical protein [Thermomicrobiales bacterium]
MPSAGATTNRTTIGRWLGAATAALALLLLLSGVTAVPAGASSRDQNVIDANDFVSWCFTNGGTPDTSHYVDYGNDIIYAFCLFPDGSSINCQFWLDGTTRCWATHPNGTTNPVSPPVGTAPPLTRPPGAGIAGTSGGAFQTGGPIHTLSAQEGGHGHGKTDKHPGGHGHGKAHKGRHGRGNKK